MKKRKVGRTCDPFCGEEKREVIQLECDVCKGTTLSLEHQSETVLRTEGAETDLQALFRELCLENERAQKGAYW